MNGMNKVSIPSDQPEQDQHSSGDDDTDGIGFIMKGVYETDQVSVFIMKGAHDTDHVGVATFVQGTVVQGDFGPRRLLSKEAFTGDKLAQIIFYSLLDVTILIDYKMTKK